MSLICYAPVVISSTATDPTNVPTTLLRPGLCMGIITATGQWSNYSASNSDGTQIAQGILPVGLQMVDPFTQLTQTKEWGMIIGGPIKAANIIGLDNNARAQLSPRFLFDDFLTDEEINDFVANRRRNRRRKNRRGRKIVAWVK